MDQVKHLPFPRPLKDSGLVQKLVLGPVLSSLKGEITLTLPSGKVLKNSPREKGQICDIKIKSSNFFNRCLFRGDIGFSESYMAGEWSTSDLKAVIHFFIDNKDYHPYTSGGQKSKLLLSTLSKAWFNYQYRKDDNSLKGSKKNIEAHYDLSNPLYKSFLDSTMAYSSGIYSHSNDDLESAQQNKYQNLANLLQIEPGQKILEIGTGWGGFSAFLAEKYDCHITSLTLSQNQYDYATELHIKKGLNQKIEIKLEDYRNHIGKYDRIVTVEMLEAVGDNYLDAFFAKCDQWLKPKGLMVHQVILSPNEKYHEMLNSPDFIKKYIFPGSFLPSLKRLMESAEAMGGFNLYQLQDIGQSYALTLRDWNERFQIAFSYLKEKGFDEEFKRKWEYYLKYCEAAFATKHITVAQSVWAKAQTPRV